MHLSHACSFCFWLVTALHGVKHGVVSPQAAAGDAAQAQASADEACSAANLARAAAEDAAAALLQTKQAELQAASLLRGSSASGLLKACTTALPHRAQAQALLGYMHDEGAVSI